HRLASACSGCSMTDKPKVPPISQQIAVLMEHLQGIQSSTTDPKYKQVLDFAKAIPPASRPVELVQSISRAFSVSEVEIAEQLEMRKTMDFAPLVQGTGWLEDYVRLTRNTEPPTVFHFFAGAVAIGAILGRNVYKCRGGAPKIYPNLCVLV